MPTNYTPGQYDPLLKLSAYEWRIRIDTIIDIKMRIRVARIVAWDYGNGPCSQHQPDLDDLVESPIMVKYLFNPEQIANELIKIGYTEKNAFKRVAPKADIEGMMRRQVRRGSQSRRGI